MRRCGNSYLCVGARTWRLTRPLSPSLGPVSCLQSSLRAVEASLGLGGSQEESLVQLQQSIAPAFLPPKPVARALQRIAASQVRRHAAGG